MPGENDQLNIGDSNSLAEVILKTVEGLKAKGRLGAEELEAALLARPELEAVLDRGQSLDELILLKSRLDEALGGQRAQARGRTPDAQAAAIHAGLEEIKEGYVKVLSEIEIDLGEEYLANHARLKGDIAAAVSIEALVDLNPEIEKVVRAYAGQIYEERNQALGFVEEVARRLAALENLFLASFSSVRKMNQAHASFNPRFESELGRVAQAIEESRDFETLKGRIFARINKLKEAIQAKNKADSARLGSMEEQLGDIKRQMLQAREQVARLEEQNRRLAHRAQFDPLTAVYNRLAFTTRLEEELAKFQRYQRPFCVILFDIDSFKRVNDTLGHTSGDKCLAEVAGTLNPLLRKTDMLARYGGDEFAILIPEAQTDQAAEVAEKLRRIIETTTFAYRGQRAPITLSLGVTQARAGDRSTRQIIDRADAALYKAKEKGRNRVERA